jgi:DeoR/GlpR family transcriptional regulator of sugar metabolism
LAKSANTIFSEERENIILNVLQQNGRVTVSEISSILGISASTVRLQLQKMHDKGLLLRTHGGAVKADYPQGFNTHKTSFEDIINFDKKMQIAIAAAATVEDGDFIAISSGSTALLFASLITDKKNLTVVTDSVPVANELLFHPNIKLYICGGQIRQRNGACFGPTAEEFLNTLKVDKSYSGSDSVDLDFGITSLDIDPRTEKCLCKCGNKCYILVDSTKFKVKPFIEKTIDISEITHLISDSSLKQEYVERLEKAGVTVILGKE